MQAIATEAGRGMIGGLVWLALLHAVWIGLATAGGVALVFQRRKPPTPRARRAILLGAMGLVAVGPPVLSAGRRLFDARQVEPAAIGAGAVVASPAADGRTARITSAPTTRDEPSSTTELHRGLGGGLDDLNRAVAAARPFGLAVWSLVVSGLAAVLALGARGLSRLRLEASPAPLVVQKRAARLARLLRLRNAPAVRVHPTLAEPCLCGVFRPVVLLPARWAASAPVESLDAVLAHEMAHARRFDHLVNLAQRGLEVVLFFHPGVHWLSRLLRRQAEHDADALAVRLTGDPLTLARTLESMARRRAGSSTAGRLGPAFGGESSFLLPRIQELLGMTPIRPRKRTWPFLAMPLAALVAFATASVGIADDEPATSQPPGVKGAKPLTPSPPDSARRQEYDRQIAYRVQFIDTPERPGLARFQDKLTPCEATTGGRAWLLDDATRDVLLLRLAHDRETKIVQAPTVTTFEDHAAVIGLGLGVDGVESYNPLELEIRKMHPDARTPDRDWRPRIELAGRHSKRGVHVSVDLRDAPAARLDDERKPAGGPAASGAREVHVTTFRDVPTHSNILISVGSRRPDGGNDAGTIERLVLVTPLRIVMDAQGEPRLDPSPAR